MYDWRFRSPGKGEPEKWLRRCRIVCREFKTTAQSSAETFAPTSGLAAIKLMVVLHCVLRLLLWTLDCADAFFTGTSTRTLRCRNPSLDQKVIGIYSGHDLASEEMFARTKECRFEMV